MSTWFWHRSWLLRSTTLSPSAEIRIDLFCSSLLAADLFCSLPPLSTLLSSLDCRNLRSTGESLPSRQDHSVLSAIAATMPVPGFFWQLDWSFSLTLSITLWYHRYLADVTSYQPSIRLHGLAQLKHTGPRWYLSGLHFFMILKEHHHRSFKNILRARSS